MDLDLTNGRDTHNKYDCKRSNKQSVCPEKLNGELVSCLFHDITIVEPDSLGTLQLVKGVSGYT